MILSRLRDFFRVFISKMTDTSCFTLVPDTVRGMKQLDRTKFLHNVHVPALKLTVDKIIEIRATCKPYWLKLDNLKPVQILGIEDKPYDRCILFHPGKISCWKDMPENVLEVLKRNDITEDNFYIKEVQLTYDNFSAGAVFKAVLPNDSESIKGYTQVGHIIHLNLRDHLLDYKSLIATVLLDKIKPCRTVVNKRKSIDNTFRNFEMELLGGDEDFFVTLKENKLTFQFDFSKVYWNTRLGEEHGRLVNCLQPGDVLFDVFAGVGPFSVPAANKKCIVFANDLNPESYKWLNHNAKINKVKMVYFKSFNMDGKDFICNIFKEFIINSCTPEGFLPPGTKIHVTMNLPATAVEYLQYFNGLIDNNRLYEKFSYDVIIHLYCFIPGGNLKDKARQLVNDKMGRDMTSQILNISIVRNVSPNKEMMKVTIKLKKEMLFAINSGESSEPPVKKQCVEKAIND